MRRELLVAFAVVMSVLIATAPVAGSHGLAVASIHTTDTDFDAGTLTNMSVVGSGDSATVELDDAVEETNQTIDDFEDDDLSEWDTSDSGSETGTVSSPVQHGSFAARVENVGGQYAGMESTSGLNEYPDQGENFTAWVRVDNASGVKIGWATQSTGTQPDTYQAIVDAANDQFELEKVDGSGSTLASAAATIDTDVWLRVEVQWNTNGKMTATLSDTGGTTLATVSATDTTFTSGGIKIEPFGGGGEHVFVDHMFEDGLPDNATYISDPHSVADSEQGFVNITTITNASATVTWETNDGTGWSQLNQTTGITTAANHTFSWSVESNSSVRVNVTVFNQSGDGAPAFAMADEGVQFTGNGSFVNNSSASPTGDLSTSSPTFEIHIEDDDFPLAQGDSVTAELFIDDTSQGTDTITSNGTASVSASPSGGDHTYHWVVNDSYGHSVQSQDFSISAPANVTFRREEPEHPIINDRQINVTIYGETDGDQFVQNFTTSDGNVSLASVPTDERLVVVAMTDGFHQREVILTDVFSQTDVYLLNTSEASVTVTFDIQDSTGEFSQADTEFIIKRSINRSLFASGGFTAEAIAGDRLGAVTEYKATLKQDQRYTIVMRNPDGDVRTLGAQVAKETGTVPVRIASVDLAANETQGFNHSARVFNSSGNQFVEFVYVDEQNQTTAIEVIIYEQGNPSNEIHNQTHTGTFGTLKVTEQVTGGDVNESWVVEFTATRGGSDEFGQSIIGRDTQPLGVPLDDAWKHRIALLSLVVAGFIVGGGVSPEAGGLAIVATAGMWNYIGWMPAEVTGVAIGFGALTAVGFAAGKRGGEPVQ